MRAAPVLLAAALALPAGAERLELRRHYQPKDREGTGRYQYVPFDVPAGTTRLAIEYRYDKQDGANVVDLGLFEPGPLEIGAARFRGWSGGERAAIVVADGPGTPGYWPGPLPEGRWHVMLGLYKVAAGGVDVDLSVELSSEPQPPLPEPPKPRANPLRPGPAWFAGDLHTHTFHSDGKLTVPELRRLAREAGLDFIAITDHNNAVHQLDPAPDDGLLVIAGEELTTPGGHASLWGVSGREFVDFRLLPGDWRAEEIVRGAVAAGALFSINHPFADCAQCAWEHPVFPETAAIEVWNRWDGPQPQAIALWDKLLKQGRRITAVGASDWHRLPQPIGRASVRVWAHELSASAILDAVRQGRVVVVRDPALPAPQVAARTKESAARVGDALRGRAGQALRLEVAPNASEPVRVEVIWSGQQVAARLVQPGETARFDRAITESGYYRVEIRDAAGAYLALTNPIRVAISEP